MTGITRMIERLQRIYPSPATAEALAADIERCCQAFCDNRSSSRLPRLARWSEDDVILISYGNSLQLPQETPLQTLAGFLERRAAGLFSSVHILPFFPFSSDDGFSVIDYRQVNPELGGWEDIERLAASYGLMVDLVINHCSRESLWFADFVANREPWCDYFIEMDPSTDVSGVTRPRNTPLLTPVHTHRGVRHVWATFSEDQIDLNFANPRVLLEFVQILLLYVERGARFIRLDAIAFLWKRVGTPCVHLPETHEVVKLLRDVLERVAPDVVLITETNVPVAENLSYFGQGDEAHMVYQFGLPPLVLHALNRGKSDYLTDWAARIPALPGGCTYLNFTASHDGIGVRPVEGLLPAHEVTDLIDCMHRFGGFVSMKANPDGSQSPYEINISLFDACMGTRRGLDHLQVPRFLCSQAIMLAMQGIPAMYIHSLTASPNDLARVEQTGRTRSINRRVWPADELEQLLDNPVTPQAEVFATLARMLVCRRQQPAFHPDARQEVIRINSDLFIFKRVDDTSGQVIHAIHNVTDRPLDLPLAALGFLTLGLRDLLEPTGEWRLGCVLTLAPYQAVWLTT
ncbi:sugar phosphorylase [Parathalassolituus penaei]|uniref:Sugar phosphorylase n=1 Tax=Parathalassolituus penaei TaxID=2997323 RepID=A0A9X3EI23_9GAMM|nr:sugar phosphorylase [Parathalassolituus penaei]MCY0964636.1 sugar phosphorylase [Parathalassolituus penaei]